MWVNHKFMVQYVWRRAWKANRRDSTETWGEHRWSTTKSRTYMYHPLWEAEKIEKKPRKQGKNALKRTFHTHEPCVDGNFARRSFLHIRHQFFKVWFYVTKTWIRNEEIQSICGQTPALPILVHITIDIKRVRIAADWNETMNRRIRTNVVIILSS